MNIVENPTNRVFSTITDIRGNFKGYFIFFKLIFKYILKTYPLIPCRQSSTILNLGRFEQIQFQMEIFKISI